MFVIMLQPQTTKVYFTEIFLGRLILSKVEEIRYIQIYQIISVQRATVRKTTVFAGDEYDTIGLSFKTLAFIKEW